MSHVTCHCPPATNANSHGPSPADSTISHASLVADRWKKLAVIDNYNFYDRHTLIHTYGHGDSMTDPAKGAESVKPKQKHAFRVV